MRYARWTFIALIVALIAAYFHYTLPQRDVVRITGTDTQRINVGINGMFYANRMRDAQGNLIGTDVLFIRAITPEGAIRVYRNEDAGFYPPYFKFDSQDLQTEADDLVSSAEEPQWVVVRHYGWRSRFLTIFPNAVSLRPVTDPAVTLIPWFNIVFLTLFVILLGLIWRMLYRFRVARIDPLIDDAAEAWDKVDAGAGAATGRIGRFFRFGRKK